jgi:crotonobetainyl-CoA:carnitine CoA-transferase CaiB-like acyl-CoA transferase
MENGTSLWWRSVARNKKCVTLDLRTSEGRTLTKRLAAMSDVLIESFRPGTMERWGLGPEEIATVNPRLVYTRISGYGQDGPYAARPGFASVCEGFGGFRYVNGFPDRPPVRPNLSLGDTVTAIHAALGTLLALFERERAPNAIGQVVDVAIYEAVFNLMEAVVPEYDRYGVVRERSGTTLTGIVPTNTYVCKDGGYVIIGANTDSIFQRLMRLVERPDMSADPRFATNADRVPHEAEIDAAISAWTRTVVLREALERLEAGGVPAGPIYSVADMLQDSHYLARGLFEETTTESGPLKVPAIPPKLARTPGRTDWPGPRIGAHNREILGGLLGLADTEVARLERACLSDGKTDSPESD